MISALTRLISKSAARLGGFRAIRPIINRSPISTTYDVDKSSQISRYSNIRGDVSLDEGSIIESNTYIKGRVSLGKESKIGRGTEIWGELIVGERTNLNGEHIIRGEVNIGSYCAIARTAEFFVKDHYMSQPAIQWDFYDDVIGERLDIVDKGPVNVKNDVWIGRHSMVLDGVTIGNGAVIGAGSIVTKDVEPYEIVAGAPAENRGWRFKKRTREQLQDISWWDWSEKKIKNNKNFFDMDLTEIENIKKIIK